ncbi:hypothetical protein [Allocoprobacillus halotolerans]|nr:hypothetical protein [Allocoprobacillus halotolerans]
MKILEPQVLHHIYQGVVEGENVESYQKNIMKFLIFIKTLIF